MEKKFTISAPGRTEICGNHTDHQRGKVLAAAVNLKITAEVEICEGDESNYVSVVSDGKAVKTIDIRDLSKQKEDIGHSANLIRGVLFYLKEKGYKIGGFKAQTTSTIPRGAGLSSSAAIEVLIGRIVSKAFNDGKISPFTIAKAGQFAENVYYEKPCGLMDQCASSFEGIVAIDFENPEDVKVERLSPDLIKNMGLSLLIINTKSNHSDLTKEYADIRAEMAVVANYFGKEVLREVDEEEFFEALKQMEEGNFSDRAILRAIHFFKEERRVEQCVKALKEQDKKLFLKTIKESGDSSYKYLQNVFSTRFCDEQKISKCLCLCEEILGDKGVCRVHGGGFAGTVQVFVENDYVNQFKKEIEEYFGAGSCICDNFVK